MIGLGNQSLIGINPIHNGSSGTYLPVKENIVMASVTFDKATRLYPGSTRPAVDQLDLDRKSVV